jgi:LmbE family N-acetylglucosaminyl deacetylase
MAQPLCPHGCKSSIDKDGRCRESGAIHEECRAVREPAATQEIGLFRSPSIKAPELFGGSGLIVAPHMDDEALACGTALAQLPNKEAWHVIYATDGMRSPQPAVPWRNKVSPELGKIRQAEARAAMACLGLPPANVHFLNLPDGRLQQHLPALRQGLARFLTATKPDHVLAPFRYDRHPDHLAVNHVLTAMVREGAYQGQLTEYFVYSQWRLLPLRDMRRYIRPGLLRMVASTGVAAQKRAALNCFKSQTTCLYPWQARPSLTAQLVDEVSQAPELFLPYNPAQPGAAVFDRSTVWIRVAHRLEPLLKKSKDRLVAWSRQGAGHG